MATSIKSTVFILFGGMGDLTWRKLVPSLFSLYIGQELPEKFQIFIVDHNAPDVAIASQHLREGVINFSRHAKDVAEYWDNFSAHIATFKGDFSDPALFNTIKQQLDEFDREWQENANRIFYLAVPSSLFSQLTAMLGSCGLAADQQHVRLAVEKPIGSDLESAKALNQDIHQYFDECQIFRLDHYLGKETVQNIMVFRFANPMFEPIWNQRYVDYVTITVAEEEGVGSRAGYYEHAGALRDMVQNHLMQLLCAVAMEPPVSFSADETRNKKVDVLHAIRTISPDRVKEFAARGQYSEGWMEGEKVLGYREEHGVSENSYTETFAAVKFYIDNWRWQGVPFYLRTGRRMTKKYSEISIQFRNVPHRLFPAEATFGSQPSRLVMNILPNEGIILTLQAKRPGKIQLKTSNMYFSYEETFNTRSPEAYETLLLDIVKGDQTLFMRTDEVEASWSILMPIIEAWKKNEPADFPNYAAGTDGPKSAEQLIIADGHMWPDPLLLDVELCRFSKKSAE